MTPAKQLLELQRQIGNYQSQISGRDTVIKELQEKTKNLIEYGDAQRKVMWEKDAIITEIKKEAKELASENNSLRTKIEDLVIRNATMRGYIDRVQERETPANDVAAMDARMSAPMTNAWETPHGRATLGADQPKWYWRAHKYGTNPYGLYGN